MCDAFKGKTYTLQAPKSIFDFIPKLKKMEEDERVKYFNGCGPRWMIGNTDAGDAIVPDTIYLLSVSKACIIHDLMYYFGKTIEEKKIADELFLKNLYTIIDEGSPWMKYLRRKRAGTYYNAVANLGEDSFGVNGEPIGFSKKIIEGTI